MLYDPVYNAAYCDKCSKEMETGVHTDWCDKEYLSGLETYSIEGFKEMMNRQNKGVREGAAQRAKFGFSKWTCACCGKAFMGY